MYKTLREKLIEEARSWIGTPWVHHQRCKGVGVDCVQFLVATAEANGVELDPIENYYRSPSGDSLLRDLEDRFERVPTDKIQPGDILLFQIRGIPHHVGLKSDRGFIHADQRANKVCEVSFGEVWQRLLVAAFEVKG